MLLRCSEIRMIFLETFETLINEEALLFAKYLRDEEESWNPRIADCFK